MENNATTICLNGELKPGDLVLSTPDEDYACLVGTVLSISKLGTPEHAAETENDTDGVHVNFMDSDYSEQRITEIEEMFSNLYGYPKPFAECPIDDTIMAPDTLIRITGIEKDTLRAILDSREAAETLCELVEIKGPGIRNLDKKRPTPAQAALHEPDAFDDPDTASLRLELIQRLNKNLSDYFDTLRSLDGQEIADMSSEIGAKMDAHYYQSEIHNFHTSEAKYLLQFQNPLEVVADAFLYTDMENRSDIMWRIFNRQDTLGGDYPLINDEPPTSDAPARDADVETQQERKKHSVLEQIRDAVKAPKEPRKDKPQHYKSEPEL